MLPDSTENKKNVKGNLYMLINNLGVMLNCYKLGYPSDNKFSRETINIIYYERSLSVNEFNNLKNIPQDSIRISEIRIYDILHGKTKISIETKII